MSDLKAALVRLGEIEGIVGLEPLIRAAIERAEQLEREAECLRASHFFLPLSVREAVRVGDVDKCREYANQSDKFAEGLQLQIERERARRASAEAALYRVQHAPKNVKALKNIAKRYFKGRTPTIVATLEHRTKELEKAEVLLGDVARDYLSLLESDYPHPDIPDSVAAAQRFLNPIKESAS